MYKRGTQKQQAQLKELTESIQIDERLIRDYEYMLQNWAKIEAEVIAEIEKLKTKLEEKRREYQQAPGNLQRIRIHMGKAQDQRDTLIGDISGHTKMIREYKNLKSRIEAMKQELAAENIDVEEVTANAETEEISV